MFFYVFILERDSMPLFPVISGFRALFILMSLLDAERQNIGMRRPGMRFSIILVWSYIFDMLFRCQ